MHGCCALCRKKSITDPVYSLAAKHQMHYAELSRNLMESPPAVTRSWPLLTHLVLSRNPLKGRRRQTLRLLQAAQKGHDAMHRGVSVSDQQDEYVLRRVCSNDFIVL